MGRIQPAQRSIAPASKISELSWIPPPIPSLSEAFANHASTPQCEQEAVSFPSGSDAMMESKDGHFGSMKIVPNPPNIDAWRERLFNVDEPITLTEEEYIHPSQALR